MLIACFWLSQNGIMLHLLAFVLCTPLNTDCKTPNLFLPSIEHKDYWLNACLLSIFTSGPLTLHDICLHARCNGSRQLLSGVKVVGHYKVVGSLDQILLPTSRWDHQQVVKVGRGHQVTCTCHQVQTDRQTDRQRPLKQYRLHACQQL